MQKVIVRTNNIWATLIAMGSLVGFPPGFEGFSPMLGTRNDKEFFRRIDENNKIHFQQITLGRDYGKEVEVVSGLKLEDQLVINPSDEIQEGVKVKITSRAEKLAH